MIRSPSAEPRAGGEERGGAELDRAAAPALSAGEATEVAPQRAAALPAGLIADDEVIILLLRPSPLYIVLVPLGSLAVIGLITFGLAYMARLGWAGGPVGWSDTSAFLLGSSLAALRVGWQALEWFSLVYVLTDRRIIRRMGVLRVAVFETPLRNIQHTSVFYRVRERICGLGTIGFATSGSNTFEAFWVMVANPNAVHRTVNEAIRQYK